MHLWCKPFAVFTQPGPEAALRGDRPKADFPSGLLSYLAKLRRRGVLRNDSPGKDFVDRVKTEQVAA